jgi:hypothetical protein
MKKVPQIDRFEYWRFLSAHFSIQKAKGIATHLLQTSPKDQLFYPLLTALYIFYGRPFKQRRNVRLPDTMIPDRFMKLHRTLIDLRDKAFAHIDYGGIPEKGIDEFNRVLIRIDNGAASVGVATLIPHGLQLKDVIFLCDELLAKCSYHLQKIWDKSIKDSYPKDGDYEVDLQEGDAFLIKKLEFREQVIPADAVKLRR